MWKCIICEKENLESVHVCPCGFERIRNVIGKRTVAPVSARDVQDILYYKKKNILDKMIAWQKHEREELERERAAFEEEKAAFEQQKAAFSDRLNEADGVLEKQRQRNEAARARREAQKQEEAARNAQAAREAARRRMMKEVTDSLDRAEFYEKAKQEREARKATLVSNLDAAKKNEY